MIPCRRCGRNKEFCGCTEARRRLIDLLFTYFAAAVIFSLGYITRFIIENTQ